MKERREFELYGIFGRPLGHTLSPAMQEAAFKAAGIKAFYLILELTASDFRKVMRGLGEVLLEGFNITVPYKETVIRYLDRLTPEARAVGAVNTVFRSGRKWVGANTDVYGFLASLSREGKFQPAGKSALVLGAGGAARAAVYGLASRGIKKLEIANRHPERAQRLIRRFRKLFPRTRFEIHPLTRAVLKGVLPEMDLVVNATSAGLQTADRPILPASVIPKASGRADRILFFDLIYHRLRTPFLEAARRRGHRVLGGLGMLVFQGARAWEIWTGKKARLSAMRAAVLQGLR